MSQIKPYTYRATPTSIKQVLINKIDIIYNTTPALFKEKPNYFDTIVKIANIYAKSLMTLNPDWVDYSLNSELPNMTLNDKCQILFNLDRSAFMSGDGGSDNRDIYQYELEVKAYEAIFVYYKPAIQQHYIKPMTKGLFQLVQEWQQLKRSPPLP